MAVGNYQNTYNKRKKKTIKKFLPINFEIKTVLKAITAKKTKNSSNNDQWCEPQKDYIVEHVMKNKGSKNGLLYCKISYKKTRKKTSSSLISVHTKWK